MFSKRKLIIIITIMFSFFGCEANDNKDPNLSHCTSDYSSSNYFHHSKIKAISLTLMQDTPDRIQVHEIGEQLSMFYCNFETKTEILLAEYKIIKVNGNQDEEVRPYQTTMPTESPIDESKGASAIRYVQLMQDFNSKFIEVDDKAYYETNKLENLPFVLSTLCSDTYLNAYHEVSNLSGSLSSILLLNNPPPQIQLVKSGREISVLYCVFNDSSDRSVSLGIISLLDNQQVELEKSLSLTNLIYPITLDEASGFGVYFIAGQLPFMDENIFNNLLHTGTETQKLIEEYKQSIFDNNTLKLEFKIDGLAYYNPY